MKKCYVSKANYFKRAKTIYFSIKRVTANTYKYYYDEFIAGADVLQQNWILKKLFFF